MMTIPTRGQVERAVKALREKDASLRTVSNTIRQSFADIIEGLVYVCDKRGVALMMIKEGADDPGNIAAETLTKTTLPETAQPII